MEMRGDGGTGSGCSRLADTQGQEVGSGLAVCTTHISSNYDFFGVNALWPNQACYN